MRMSRQLNGLIFCSICGRTIDQNIDVYEKRGDQISTKIYVWKISHFKFQEIFHQSTLTFCRLSFLDALILEQSLQRACQTYPYVQGRLNTNIFKNAYIFRQILQIFVEKTMIFDQNLTKYSQFRHITGDLKNRLSRSKHLQTEAQRCSSS